MHMVSIALINMNRAPFKGLRIVVTEGSNMGLLYALLNSPEFERWVYVIIIWCNKFCNRTVSKMLSEISLSRLVKKCFPEEGTFEL